jgi:integration host factor subunit beta
VIKSELILRIAGHSPHLFQRDVEKVVATILDEIESAFARGTRVERRFGSFSVKRRKSRVGRNPGTGARVDVPEKGFVLFRPGHEIRKRINPEPLQHT